MAKTDLEQLVVQLGADFNKFQRDMAKAQGVANSSAGRIEQRFKAMNAKVSASLDLGGALKGFASGFIGGFGIEAISRAAFSAIKSIADIGDAAKKLGVTTDEYQQMAFAAKLAGVETDTLAGGLKKLAVNTSDASRGQGELGSILRLNGVSIRDANGSLLSQTEVLGRVADLVRNAANEQDKAAIAQAAFGKSGIELLGFLEGGANGVRQAMAEANSDGLKFSADQIAAAQRIDDEFDKLIETISVGMKGAFLSAAQGISESGIIQKIGEIQEAGNEAGKSLREMILSLGRPDLANLSGQALGGTVKPSFKANFIPGFDPNSANKLTGVLPPTKSTILPPPRQPKTTSGKSDAQREAESRQRTIEDVIKALTFESAQLQRTARDQAIYNELNRAGVAINTEAGKTIAAKAGKNFDTEAAQEAAKKAREEVKRNSEEVARKSQELSLAKKNLVERAQDDVAALQAEAAAMAANIGSLDGYGSAVERVRISQQMLNEAKSAGIAITPELKSRIDQLAGSYVAAQQQIDAMAQKQEAFKQGIEGAKALSKDVLGGFVNDLKAGEEPLDALLNGLNKIADSLLNMAIDGLVENAFGALLGGGSSGGGGLFGSIFGGFRAAGGPISPGRAYMVGERGPEMIVPRTPGIVIPNGSLNGNGANVRISVNVNGATGNAEVQRMVQAGVSASLSEYARRQPRIDAERQLRS